MDVLEGLGGRARGAPGALGLSRRLVGRDAETARFSRWLRDVVTGTPRPPVLMLTGASGAGKTRLLRDWVARAELALEVIRAHAAERSPVSWLVRQASGGRLDPASPHGMVGAAQELAQGSSRRVLVLEAADRLGAVDTLLLLAFARSIPRDGALALMVSSCEPLRDVPGEIVPLGPLNLDALRAWTAGAVSDGTLNDILRVSAGLPRGIESELERLARSRGAPSPPDETDQALRAWLTALDPSEIEALALLAALDGELEPQLFGVAPEAFSTALKAGLVRRDRARLRLRRRERLEALRRALPRRKLTAAHARIARTLAERSPASPDARTESDVIHHAALGGLLGEAEERLRAALELFRKDPRPLIHRSAELMERTRDTTALLLLGELALLASEPRTALSAAARLLRLRPPAKLAAQARLLGADALIRLGRARRSERISNRVLEGEGVASLRASALEQLARARMQSGDHSGAERAALRALELEPPPSTRVKALETLGVAATYLGRLEEAAARFSEVSAAIDPAVQPRDACRLLGHRAILAFRAGRIADAARDHREALQLAEHAGLDDLVAVSSLNLGTAEQQLGELGGALASYQRGLLVARAVGRESTELTLRFNLANLRAEIGDLHGAEQELDELARRASSPRRELLVPSMAVLHAEIALARRDLPRAHQQIQQARAAFAERGLLREGVEADACEAELELERGDVDAAERRAGDAEATARSLGATDVALRAALLLARAEATRGDPHAITRLEELRVEAAETGQQLLEARAATELH
ncbi:MAG TPA: AAA family ATPase, partial [Polyangiaceae bacterium]